MFVFGTRAVVARGFAPRFVECVPYNTRDRCDDHRRIRRIRHYYDHRFCVRRSHYDRGIRIFRHSRNVRATEWVEPPGVGTNFMIRGQGCPRSLLPPLALLKTHVARFLIRLSLQEIFGLHVVGQSPLLYMLPGQSTSVPPRLKGIEWSIPGAARGPDGRAH